jgi:hypothetical protein
MKVEACCRKLAARFLIKRDFWTALDKFIRLAEAIINRKPVC